jgi:3',5'-cyclic AMP phosphodiesterase CpdA
VELRLARRELRYIHAKETIQRLVDKAMRGEADHVVLSGDLTALALDEEFEGARKALGRLVDDPGRVTVIPGNHDTFTPGSIAKKRFERWFEDLLVSDLPELRAEGPWPHVRLVGEHHAIVGLCSARLPPLPGIAAGRVGDDQLLALLRVCDHPRVRGRTVFAVVHHSPLRPSGRIDRPDHGLADAPELLEACKLGGVAAILCGHIHSRFQVQSGDGGPRVVCAGSSTWLGREGYWLIDADARGIRSVEERELEPEVIPVPAAKGPVPAGAPGLVAAG